MKCYIVSSTITFVPNNYEDFVIGVANDPCVQGLILIENRNWATLAKATALIVSFAAPRLGWQLIVNHFASSVARKKKAYEVLGKKFFIVDDINSSESLKIIENENVDLLLNARTRYFFKKKLLAAPKIGCINIHHGLLPDQRGLMCDFWAHFYKTKFGFSIHQMTPRLDDGPILKVSEVTTDQSSYLDSIQQGSAEEAQAIIEVIHKIALTKKIEGIENLKTENTIYRTNPSFLDLYKLKLRGTKI